MGGNESTSSSKPLNAAQRSSLYDAAISKIGGTIPTGSSAYYVSPQDYYANVQYQDTSSRSAADPGKFTGSYVPAEFTSAGSAKTIGAGDYNKLQQALITARTAPLALRQREDESKANESLAKRGIWSSGIAERDLNDIREGYSAQEQAAINEAIAQRYGLQQADYAQANQFALANAQMKNQTALANASNQNAWNQSANQYALSRAALLNQYNQAQDNYANQFNLAKASAQQQAALTNAQKQYESAWRPADYYQGLWNGTGGVISSGNSSGWSI